MTSDLTTQLEASVALEARIAHLSSDEKNAARREARLSLGTLSGEVMAAADDEFDAASVGFERQPSRDELCGDAREPAEQTEGDELRKAAERALSVIDEAVSVCMGWSDTGSRCWAREWRDEAIKIRSTIPPQDIPAGVRQPATPEEAAAVIHAERSE